MPRNVTTTERRRLSLRLLASNFPGEPVTVRDAHCHVTACFQRVRFETIHNDFRAIVDARPDLFGLQEGALVRKAPNGARQ